MSDAIANIIVVCEDQEHQNLVRRYLIRVGHASRSIRFYLPQQGSGSQYVRQQFPRQIAACRSILGRGTRAFLILMTDADNLTVLLRERTLHDELVHAGGAPIGPTEPVVILIPKWQVETWIKCLLGIAMDEEDQRSDQPPVTADDIKHAASALYGWTRPNATPSGTCVPSLEAAIPRWRRIPEIR